MSREKNFPAISILEQEKLSKSKVLIIGAGGLGGTILEHVTRLGIGNITIIDPDQFEPSNLNRQLLSSSLNLGKEKSAAAWERAKVIDPKVNITALTCAFTPENAVELLKGVDLVFDAVDNVPDKLTIAKYVVDQGIPLIHGAINGWFGQVLTILPERNTLPLLYGDIIESEYLGSPSHTAGLIATMQVTEGLKVLLNRGDLLVEAYLYIDLLKNIYTTIPL